MGFLLFQIYRYERMLERRERFPEEFGGVFVDVPYQQLQQGVQRVVYMVRRNWLDPRAVVFPVYFFVLHERERGARPPAFLSCVFVFVCNEKRIFLSFFLLHVLSSDTQVAVNRGKNEERPCRRHVHHELGTDFCVFGGPIRKRNCFCSLPGGQQKRGPTFAPPVFGAGTPRGPPRRSFVERNRRDMPWPARHVPGVRNRCSHATFQTSSPHTQPRKEIRRAGHAACIRTKKKPFRHSVFLFNGMNKHSSDSERDGLETPSFMHTYTHATL